jgi:hypothetical protein
MPITPMGVLLACRFTADRRFAVRFPIIVASYATAQTSGIACRINRQATAVKSITRCSGEKLGGMSSIISFRRPKASAKVIAALVKLGYLQHGQRHRDTERIRRHGKTKACGRPTGSVPAYSTGNQLCRRGKTVTRCLNIICETSSARLNGGATSSGLVARSSRRPVGRRRVAGRRASIGDGYEQRQDDMSVPLLSGNADGVRPITMKPHGPCAPIFALGGGPG